MAASSASASSACRSSESISARRASAAASRRSLTHILKSVATWSFRDRAVCSLPAVSPISSPRRASTFMWMSSSAVEKRKDPSSISDKTVIRPFRISSASLLSMMPVAASIATCAREASMSWRARRRSKAIDALMASISASGPEPNRPPHMAFETVLFAMAAPGSRKGQLHEPLG